MNYINEDNEQFQQALDFLRACKTISLDTETTGLDPYQDQILLISAGNKYKQFVFDVAKLGKAINRLKPLLESEHVVKLLHNAKYDYKMFKTNLNITLENMQCLMINEQLLVNGRRVSSSLETIAQKYSHAALNKEIREQFQYLKFGDSFTNDQLVYACEDVAHLETIRLAQTSLLQKHNLMRVWKIETEFISAIADLELNGAYVDKDLWMAAEKSTRIELAESYNAMNKLFTKVVPVDLFNIPSINYNSPKQLLPVLKSVLGKRGVKLTSTASEVLQDFEDDEFIGALLKYRKLTKRLSTYGSEFLTHINPVTRRIHSDFYQLGGMYEDTDQKDGTGTGRLSSKKPNMQNIPIRSTDIYRNAFIPQFDTSLLGTADYSSMELRLLADLSKDPAWLEIFDKDLDAHSEVGSKIYRKTIRKPKTNGPDDPGENWELRKKSKELNLGRYEKTSRE